MSKVILVMEEPKNCFECPCRYITEGAYWDACQVLNNKELEDICKEEKPKWCPLKSLPKKRDGHFTYDEYGDGWDAGFNACIDEILKEEKWV